MVIGTEFLQAYERVQLAAGRREGVSALRDLASWRGFVNGCAAGYDDVLPEYVNDLWVRDSIEQGLADESLQGLPGYDDFSRAVRAVDERFREIATVGIRLADPEALAWWHHVIPPRGSQEFADDVRRQFGVTIEVVD
ncbi:hypothetical protein [Streptomyces sp. NRRL WC-3725]|uniref:hypothetical protein n=1 Tax=Streptomyces sp. NRRL WC-3725 TaxID=1463933 RepID=UPI00068FFFFE|nr:hypothetical protein [Streptomyces sp. NRRL WC-3725]